VSPDVTILYDSIRWEEKALLEAGKKKNISIQMVDCKKLAINLEKKPEDYGVVIQRCVSYYRNLHSTAALEGLGINYLHICY
jgi:[lysine-biosynthesis-protein LysW]--L-2-aminoadipate ligase